MLDARYRIQDAGYKIQDAGCWYAIGNLVPVYDVQSLKSFMENL